MGSQDIEQIAARFRAHLGAASGDEVERQGLRWQAYESGGMVVASARGVHVVYGEIARLYRSVGGPAGGLGAPVTDELDAGDGVGRYNDFEQGSVYWSPVTGAHEVHGNIGMRWAADGRVKGRLGYPVTDELAHPRGAYQYFQYGALRWSPQDGVQAGPPPDRLYGYADTHAHPAAHLGFGGGLISGLVEGPPEHALADCSRDHGLEGTGLFHLGARDLPGSLLSAFVNPLAGLAIRAVDDVAHGVTLGALEGAVAHWTEGYPKFDGWPRYNSRVHQQMYLQWVERSYRYGQRLMVALANHSNVLATTGGSNPGQRDMDAGIAQLRYLRDLVDRVDWMELALSPSDARDIISRDRMAVVLGVELDTLGGLEQRARDWDDRRGGDRAAAVTDAELDALVEVLHDELGVRYVFPVHLTDNAFGGAALYRTEFMEASALEGRPITTQDRTDLAFGRVNRHGLSDAGRRLLTRLMARGMMVDIDHMSWRATQEALAFTTDYPVVSGHATFHELAVRDAHADAGGSDESRKTPATLSELARRGSFVGVQPVAQPLAPHPDADAGVSGDCPGSSTQFARAYQYAVARTGGRVAIGSDLNGFASACGPRFGPGAAPGLADTDSRRLVEGVQRGGVRYTAPLRHPVVRRLEHPGHMWNERRRELLYAVHVGEAGQSVPRDLFKPHIAATAEGVRSEAEPRDGLARAAFRAYRGLGPDGLNPADREVHADIVWVLARHRAAGGGPNPPLERCVTGGHDWDYNLEGLAHYGLIPDLIHDLGNLGLAWDAQLMPLLTSAETVVSTWERCHDQGAQTQPFVAREPDPRTLGPSLAWVKSPVGVRLPKVGRPSLG